MIRELVTISLVIAVLLELRRIRREQMANKQEFLANVAELVTAAQQSNASSQAVAMTVAELRDQLLSVANQQGSTLTQDELDQANLQVVNALQQVKEGSAKDTAASTASVTPTPEAPAGAVDITNLTPATPGAPAPGGPVLVGTPGQEVNVPPGPVNPGGGLAPV